MGNEILNATGLDETNDWSSTLGGFLSSDDDVVGRPGVNVVGATRLGVVRGAKADLVTSSFAVAQGEQIEGLIHFAAAGGTCALEFEVIDGTGTGESVGSRQILPNRSPVGPGRAPRRGIPEDFYFASFVIRAPESGFARLRVVATAFGGDVAAYAMRPFLSPLGSTIRRQCWAAGQHSNADLGLESWPSSLPPAVAGSFMAEPISSRKGFTGDSGVPGYRRLTTSGGRWLARASWKLATRDRDLLDQFFRETDGEFYFVRPDTFQLCRAQWTDKDPRDSGSGGDRSTEVEFLLEVA